MEQMSGLAKSVGETAPPSAAREVTDIDEAKTSIAKALDEKVVFHIFPNTDDAQKQYPNTTTSENKNGDAGVDIRFPKKVEIPPGKTIDIDMEVKIWCEAGNTNIPFLLIPRSSIGKTPLIAEESVCPLQGAHVGVNLPVGTFKFMPEPVQPDNLPSLTVKLTNTAKTQFVIAAGTSYFQVVDINLRPPTYRRISKWDPLPPTFPQLTGGFDLLICDMKTDVTEAHMVENTMIIMQKDIILEPKTVTDVHLGVRACLMLNSTKPWASWLFPLLGETPLIMKNWVGLIDCGYRGELIAKIYNSSDTKFVLSKETAPFGIAPPFGSYTRAFRVPMKHPQFVDGATSRGNGAFGSTGTAGKT